MDAVRSRDSVHSEGVVMLLEDKENISSSCELYRTFENESEDIWKLIIL